MKAKPPPPDLCPRCGNNVTSSTHLLRRCWEADAHEDAVRTGRAACSVCGKQVRVLKDGTIGLHNWRPRGVYDGRSNRCSGWGKPPKESGS
jgi:hypothetical protein